MLARFKPIVSTTWRWYRCQSLFVQLFLVVPVLCAIALTLLVGNMGLALMGTAIALNSLLFGWIGGAISVVLVKAGLIIARDRDHAPRN